MGRIYIGDWARIWFRMNGKEELKLPGCSIPVFDFECRDKMVAVSSHHAAEVAKAVLEVAEVAWDAIECCRHCHHSDNCHSDVVVREHDKNLRLEKELDALRSENLRLRCSLEEYFKILYDNLHSPRATIDCPPDVSLDRDLVLTNPTDETSVDIELEIPDSWGWVKNEEVPCSEVWSEIDNDNYIVVGEEHVLDGIANFIAGCISLNPKAQNLTPQELQKALTKALSDTNRLEKMVKMWHAGETLYTLSTWGLALVGLYRSRGVLMLAARGVHATSRALMKAI